jgi:hypothetical protein
VNGEVFTRIRDGAIEGKQVRRVTWHEWSATDASPLDDRAVWVEVNPGLITGRLLWSEIEDERGQFSDEGFGRERLGLWSNVGLSPVIDSTTWRLRGDPLARPVGQYAYGIDVSPDRQTASIGMAAWTADGGLFVEWVEGRNSADWVVAVAELINKAKSPRCFVVDKASPASGFAAQLIEKQIPTVVTSANDYANACARFYDATMSGLLVHLDQPTLNVALSKASKRDIGAEGLWAWNRRKADSDITPLVAVTLAIHGLDSEVKNGPRKLSELYAF